VVALPGRPAGRRAVAIAIAVGRNQLGAAIGAGLGRTERDFHDRPHRGPDRIALRVAVSELTDQS